MTGTRIGVHVVALTLMGTLAACGGPGTQLGEDAGPSQKSNVDAGSSDSGPSGSLDAGEPDSGQNTGHQDAGPPAMGIGDAGYTGLGALMPQVVNSGGTVLNPTKVLPITYANDPNRTDIDAFITNYAQSVAWTSQSAEYNVGPLQLVGPGHLTTNAPATISDAQVQALIKTNTSGTNPPWGAADPGTVYAFFAPSGTKITGGGGPSCSSYLGYHDETSFGVAYAIIPDCPGGLGMGYTDIQVITSTANHEILEGATDPLFQDNQAYAQTDDDHIVWAYVTGGEVADMCSYADTANWQPPDMTYLVQRSWSNVAAAAGHDPCVGAPTVPYYQTIPDLPDSEVVSYYGTNVTTKALKIAMGATGTLTLHVYADAPSGPFTVMVQDESAWFGGTALLDITTPSGTYNVGDAVQVMVTVKGQDSNLGSAETFIVTTSPATGHGPSTYYFGLIGQ